MVMTGSPKRVIRAARVGLMGITHIVSGQLQHAKSTVTLHHPQRCEILRFDMTPPTFEFINNGPEIYHTNYWDSSFAQQGQYYLTWNDKVARLLVPETREDDLPDMAAAKDIILSQGPWREHDDQLGWELLFDDGSKAPFCLHLSQAQTDTSIPQAAEGEAFKLAIWTRKGRELQFNARFRRVEAIPYLEPWRHK
jgi:hypothetical protein